MSVRSLNKVMLIGNLTRDPQIRYTPSGTAVCTFGLATNRSWVPSDGGDRQEETEFHNITAWAKLAEICSQLLHKGDKVYVDGRIRSHDWKTQEGQDRRSTEIVIDNMMLLSNSRSGGGSYNQDDGAGDGQGYSAGKYTKGAPKAAASDDQAMAADDSNQAAPADDVKVDDVSDDIPF